MRTVPRNKRADTEHERASRPLSAREQNRRDVARMKATRRTRDSEKAGDLEHLAETVKRLPTELQEDKARAKQRRESTPTGGREEA